MRKNAFLILIPILVAVVQISFLNSLGGVWGKINLILSSIILITIIFGYTYGLWFAAISGLFLDLYSPLFFGAFTFILLSITFVINFLFNNFFTNKSLYSLLVLGGGAIILYNFLTFLFFKFAYFLNVVNLYLSLNLWWWRDLLEQLVMNIIALSILFILVNKISKRLKAVFILN